MITNEDIIYNHNLFNYSYLEWNRYCYELDKYGDNYIYEIFKDLNCDRYNKYGQQLISINDYEYQLLLNNAIRVLDKLTNCLLYNNLFYNLIHIHKINIQVCEEYSARLKETETHKTNRKSNKKPKVKDEYVRSVSTDLFTGEPKYIYSNLKTGDEIISDNPDLLEELNKPKEKKKKAVKVLSLPIGFSFKINK
jgi:hypothetical protein